VAPTIDDEALKTEARILELARSGPHDGSTHWSSYRLAQELGLSQSAVNRVWRRFGLQAHRSRSYMASNDPEFEQNAADIIGLYLQPPVHAAVFCVDEKSAIPPLHSPKVPAIVPSISIKTCQRKFSGCFSHTCCRVALMASISVNKES
jgi:hypothetical protein